MLKTLALTGLDHEAEASWVGVLDLAVACPTGWSLAGGQVIYLHTMLRGGALARPSSDADLVIDLRAEPGAALKITNALQLVGFQETLRDTRGRMHRWKRGDAQIDVLQPRGLSQSMLSRLKRAGLETIGAPGSQHLLNRTEFVEVSYGEKQAVLRTPTIWGAIIAKAAGYQEIIDDPHSIRHLADILTLAPLVTGRDLRNEPSYKRLESQRVGNAIGKAKSSPVRIELLRWFPHDLDDRIASIERAHQQHLRRTASPSSI